MGSSNSVMKYFNRNWFNGSLSEYEVSNLWRDYKIELNIIQNNNEIDLSILKLIDSVDLWDSTIDFKKFVNENKILVFHGENKSGYFISEIYFYNLFIHKRILSNIKTEIISSEYYYFGKNRVGLRIQDRNYSEVDFTFDAVKVKSITSNFEEYRKNKPH